MSQPESFDWIITDVLAAMARPSNPRQTMEHLQDHGIDVIVTLTERPLSEPLVEEFGIENHHIPIADFTAPSREQVEEFVNIVRSARSENRKVVVHCHAGMGRTGTMVACYLVSVGRSSSDAIAEVRRIRPGSIETYAQESLVHKYARELRKE